MNKQNLIHVFNARGNSFLTLDYQIERIRELEAENAKLKILLKEASSRLKRKSEKRIVRNSTFEQ